MFEDNLKTSNNLHNGNQYVSHTKKRLVGM